MREFLHVGDTRLHLSKDGDGQPVVLLHGGPGAFDYFADSVLATWLTDDRLVCSYDQRGCRESTSPGPFTLADHTSDLDAVRKHLQAEKLDLVGHSWGAYLGLRYAAAFPERIRRLVLVTPIGAREGWNLDFHRNINARHRGQQLAKLNAVKKAINRCRDTARRKELYRQQSDLAMPSYMAERHRHLAPRVAFFDRELAAKTVESMLASYGDPSWESQLRSRTWPVLIVHGLEDPLPPRIVQELREMIPHAEVAAIPGCGHFPWIEKPVAMRDALLRFLDNPVGPQ